MSSAATLGAEIGGPVLGTRSARAEDHELLERYVHTGAEELREEITRRFSSLAERLARRYSGKGEPLEDLEQVAHIGLAKAIDRFDPERRRPFQTYAIPTILGELRRHFRDHCWTVHVPRGVKDLGMKVPEAVEELSAELEREPTIAEIATALDVTTEEVVEVIIAQRAARPARLDGPIDGDASDGGELAEVVGGEDPNFERVEDRIVVADRIRRLGDREREVLRLRFGEDLSQNEIAATVGVSQMQVSRILRASLERLQVE